MLLYTRGVGELVQAHGKKTPHGWRELSWMLKKVLTNDNVETPFLWTSPRGASRLSLTRGVLICPGPVSINVKNPGWVVVGSRLALPKKT
jgi:hypothetical protein